MSEEVDNLLDTAKRLREANGVFLVTKESKEALETAVRAVEATPGSRDASFLGDWTLLCTCSNLETPFAANNPVRDTIVKTSNEFLTVKQRIRSSSGSDKVDRVDNIIEFDTPDTIGSIFPNLPDAISSLELFNPLQVSKSKVVLIHDAQVLDTYGDRSLFTTKITLKSAVLNAAGTSTNLDPNGGDIAGINLPEFAGVSAGGDGSFETTYLDEQVRVSRGRIGLGDQLRVFVRDSFDEKAEALEDSVDQPLTEEVNNETVGAGGSDDYDLTPSA